MVLTISFNNVLFLCSCSAQRRRALFWFPDLQANGLLWEREVLCSNRLTASQGQVNGPRSAKEVQRQWGYHKNTAGLLMWFCFQFWTFSDTKEIPDGCRNRGSGRNLNASIGCQVNEADRPVKRLRRKRRLLLESEDDEENAYEEEVNEAACLFFRRSVKSMYSAVAYISLHGDSWTKGSCFVPMRTGWVTAQLWSERSHYGWTAHVKSRFHTVTERGSAYSRVHWARFPVIKIHAPKILCLIAVKEC